MIAAMKQALEALERLNDIDGMYSWVDTEQALRQAIEQAEKQEPVAWMYVNVDGECEQIEYGACDYDDPSITFLYAAPPRKEWVGLTELEVKHYNNRLSGSNVAQEIESKLRERNT